MIIAVQIADELLGRFTDGEGFSGWTRRRAQRPIAALADLSPGASPAHLLTIVPRGVEAERISRGQLLLTTTIDLAVQNKIRLGGTTAGATENDDFDGVLEAVEKVFDLVYNKQQAVLFPGEDNEASFLEAAITTMDIREVDESRVATAVITAQYQSTREAE